MAKKSKGRIALFSTCLVDFWRPSIIEACVKLLVDAGFRTTVPDGQTCCGQVLLNGGDLKGARRLAARHIAIFKPFDYVVIPSGSCAGTVINQYPTLFGKGTDLREQALSLSKKTFELTQFLARHSKKRTPKGKGKPIAFHDSCSCWRELQIRQQPRELLAKAGFDVTKAEAPERCCGFGGVFSVKYGEISSHLAGAKCAALAKTGATVIAGADLGCLLNIAGKLKAEGSEIEVRHVAEVLAGRLDAPAIGEEEA